MTKPTKILLFFVAVLSMAGFAGASIMMADGRSWLATLFFVLAFAMTSFGFVTRRKALSRSVSE